MRYDRTRQILNRRRLYSEHFEERGVRHIQHYGSARMYHPTAEERSRLEVDRHVWKSGDRFYKLANRYYGNAKYWWILAWYNLAPTEAYINTGDIISIPISLSSIMQLLGM